MYIISTTTPPKAIPTEARLFMSQPSLIPALGELLAPPEPLEPDGDEEVGPETELVGEGVKTPPEGSWAIQDEAADAAS
jgi:hypothetical protein